MKSLGHFFSHWQNWLGFLIVLTFTFVALAAPVLSPADKKTIGAFKKVGFATDLTPRPPSEKAILGTVPGQFDVYHALVWGSREALQFGLLVALGSFIFGVLFGAIAGYAGGLVNSVMMRIADAFLSFPILAGVVFLQQLVAVTIESMGGIYWFNLGSFGKVVDFQFTPPAFAVFLMQVDPILISLILFSWMPIARVVNTMVITLKDSGFIQATRALGGSPWWIISRHLIPNAVAPAIVLATRDVGSSVILQATITFIGLGGESAWGILLSMGRNWVIGPGGDLLATWWVFLPATLALMLFGIGWNLLGDGLVDALSPEASWQIKKVTQNDREISDKKPAALPASMQPRRISPKVVATSPELDPVLRVARAALLARNLEHSLHAYSHLIARNRHVAVIVRDLIQTARQFPDHAYVWQVLGDAFARSGNHEHAAKAYDQFIKLRQ